MKHLLTSNLFLIPEYLSGSNEPQCSSLYNVSKDAVVGSGHKCSQACDREREREIFVLLFLGNCLVLFNYVLIMVWTSLNTVWANGMLYIIFSFISLLLRTAWGNCFFEG